MSRREADDQLSMLWLDDGDGLPEYELPEPEPALPPPSPATSPPPSATPSVEVEPPEDAPRDGQDTLFGPLEAWRDEWVGMPEFVQKDLTPLKTIFVHFETREDVAAFAELIGQDITMQTQSLWYPKAEIARMSNKRYIDGAGPAWEYENEDETDA